MVADLYNLYHHIIVPCNNTQHKANTSRNSVSDSTIKSENHYSLLINGTKNQSHQLKSANDVIPLTSTLTDEYCKPKKQILI